MRSICIVVAVRQHNNAARRCLAVTREIFVETWHPHGEYQILVGVIHEFVQE
jgi:hypothetical protein